MAPFLAVVDDEAMFHLSKAPSPSWISVFIWATLLVVSIAHAGPLTRSEMGELFLFGVPEASLSKQVSDHLMKNCPGSLLLFRRNLTSNQQALQLIEQLKSLHAKCSKQTLLIGVDQEGGQVARIPFDPPMPSAWALGATKNPQLAEEFGYEVGRALRRFGINMDLAPVLDIGSAMEKSFIGSRSFGPDPETVAEIGAAFSFGLVRSRVLPVAKHFPGLGPISNDPHRTQIRRSVSHNSLWRFDVQPFREFTQIFPTAIMPSHLAYPGLDQQAIPGTFSKTLLQGWLREKLNYHGLIVSDDLLMKGAGTKSDFSRNVVRALKAGVDIVMVSWSLKDQNRAVQAVRTALNSGELSEKLLREKIDRVQQIKKIIGAPRIPVQTASKTRLLFIGNQRYADLVYEVLRQNMDLENVPLLRPSITRVYLWPQDLRMQWQLERSFQRRISPGLPDPAKVGSKDLILAFARTKREAREIAKWNPALKKRVVVINQVEPGLIQKGYLSQLDLYLEHPMLGAELAKKMAPKQMYSAQ